MSIDPEVIPLSSSAGSHAVSSIPRSAIYETISIVMLLVVGIFKTLFPLIVMGLILGLIWNQAKS